MNSDGTLSKVSLIVITRNEEENLPGCLESARGAGEIIVVDSFSTDKTGEIAERFGATVFKRKYVSAADQKNWALRKVRLEWILILDADERLSGELRASIEREIVSPRADGYWLRRSSEFFDRRIRFCGWQRDRVLRFFRNGAGHYPERAVHEKLALRGSVRTLSGYLDHRPYASIPDYLERLNSYSSRGAMELHKAGKPWFPAIITHPLARFIRQYFLMLGFLDGFAGLMLCVMSATSVFFKYAALKDLAEGRISPPE